MKTWKEENLLRIFENESESIINTVPKNTLVAAAGNSRGVADEILRNETFRKLEDFIDQDSYEDKDHWDYANKYLLQMKFPDFTCNTFEFRSSSNINHYVFGYIDGDDFHIILPFALFSWENNNYSNLNKLEELLDEGYTMYISDLKDISSIRPFTDIDDIPENNHFSIVLAAEVGTVPASSFKKFKRVSRKDLNKRSSIYSNNDVFSHTVYEACINAVNNY